MKRALTLALMVCCLAVLLAGCKQQPAPQPVPQPTAEQYFQYGMQAFQQENYPQAQAQFEAAVQLAPAMADAHYYLGLCYFKQNMLRRAEQSFAACLQLVPGHVLAHEALGLLYYAMNDFPRAKREFEQAAALYSVNAQVYYYLGAIAMSENRCKDALGYYKRCLEIDSSLVQARTEYDAAKRRCAGGKPAPQPKPATSFQGGAKALDPANF